MNRAELKVAQVASIVGCHRNSVLRYEKKGIIRSFRDHNGFRRFTLEEALKLKRMLAFRTVDEGNRHRR